MFCLATFALLGSLSGFCLSSLLCYLLLGILKFHECYLGEGPAGHSGDLQDRSSGLHTLASSALEQLSSSVREALGVETHFVR